MAKHLVWNILLVIVSLKWNSCFSTMKQLFLLGETVSKMLYVYMKH